jgi:hypothetical protein
MSDDTGMLQHARWSIPDPNHGYTLDDNVRAFVVALQGHACTSRDDLLALARRYLAFMVYAQREDGVFRNFAGYDRQWLEDAGSPDSNGRAAWALGYGVRHAPEVGMRDGAMWLFDRALPHIDALTSPRAVASAILGCAEVYAADRSTGAMLAQIDRSAAYLAGLFGQVARGEWQWFEQSLTYGNATLPQAMLMAGALTGNARYLHIGQRSLEFLIELVFTNGQLDLIGQDGWYEQGTEPASFDQQPIDAACMVEGLLVAQRLLDEPRYGMLARRALEWFYGRNRLGTSLYDETTGGCFDALIAEGVNRNQGAESTLAHLSARLLMAILAFSSPGLRWQTPPQCQQSPPAKSSSSRLAPAIRRTGPRSRGRTWPPRSTQPKKCR